MINIKTPCESTQKKIENDRESLAQDVKVFLEKIKFMEDGSDIIEGIKNLRDFYNKLINNNEENIYVYMFMLSGLTLPAPDAKTKEHYTLLNSSVRFFLEIVIAKLLQVEALIKDEKELEIAHFFMKEVISDQSLFVQYYMRIYSSFIANIKSSILPSESKLINRSKKHISEQIEIQLGKKIVSSIVTLCNSKEQARVYNVLGKAKDMHKSIENEIQNIIADKIEVDKFSSEKKEKLKCISKNLDDLSEESYSGWKLIIESAREKISFCKEKRLEECSKNDQKNTKILEILDKMSGDLEFVSEVLCLFLENRESLIPKGCAHEGHFLCIRIIYCLLVKIDRYEKEMDAILSSSKKELIIHPKPKRHRSHRKHTIYFGNQESDIGEMTLIDEKLLADQKDEINENEATSSPENMCTDTITCDFLPSVDECADKLEKIVLGDKENKKIEIQFDIENEIMFYSKAEENIRDEIEVVKINNFFSTRIIALLERIEDIDKKLTYNEVVCFVNALRGKEIKGDGSKRKLEIEGRKVFLHEGHGKDRARYCNIASIKQLRALLRMLGITSEALRKNEWIPSSFTIQEQDEKVEKRNKMGKK